MKVVKVKSEFGLNIFLKEDDKYIGFTYGGNGDLYWSYHSIIDNKPCEEIENSVHEFIITKENYAVYSLFEQLFYDIKNIVLFDDEEKIPFYIESEEEKRNYLKEIEEEKEYQKMQYRLYNCSNYNELYNDAEQTITWYSDETAHKVANFLKIKKNDDTFKLEFYTQPYVEGYEEDFHSISHIPIRFRNSGSCYKPFNIIFMRMYNSMQEIDDVNDIGHQIHFEEYDYNNRLVKKMTNTNKE